MGLIFSKFQHLFFFTSHSHSSQLQNQTKAIHMDTINPRCAPKESQSKDWISELPDDIIASILSQLSLKELARCSVISRRWRYLWKLCNHLDFENDVDYKPCKILDDGEKQNFVKWVDGVLESHDTTKVEQVTIRYGLNKLFKSNLDKWLKIVFQKQVESLDLHLRLRDHIYCLSNIYTLTRDIFCASTSCIAPDSHFIGFKSLKSLRLNEVKVSDELVEFVLYNCPALERLHIIQCRPLSNFRVTGKHHALRFLELSSGIRNIEISDVNNLVSLTSRQCFKDAKLQLKNVPSLSYLHLSGDLAKSLLGSRMNDTIAQLSCSLKSLTLSFPHALDSSEFTLWRLKYFTRDVLQSRDKAVAVAGSGSNINRQINNYSSSAQVPQKKMKRGP